MTASLRGTSGRLVALLGVALAGSAGAAPAPGALLTPPAGWRADDAAATRRAIDAGAFGHFGGHRAQITAAVVAPPRPGLALDALRVTVPLRDGRDAAVRAELDEFHAASRRARLTAKTIHEDVWQERVDPAARSIEARLVFRDPDNQVVVTARLVIAADADRLVAVHGECLAHADAEPALVTACTAALATLDPAIAPDARVALALPPAAPPGAALATAAPSTMSAPPRGLDDGSRVVLPPMSIPHDPLPADRRPFYVGLGVIVMAALFWWNRRQRDRFEREDDRARRPPRSRPRAAARMARVDDDDADDLHAAARGEPSETPDRPDRPDRSENQDHD